MLTGQIGSRRGAQCAALSCLVATRVVLACAWLLAGAGVHAVCASRVSANQDVELGVQLESDASFEEALLSYERAWHSDALTIEELASLVAHRAVVHFALEQREPMETDLALLAVIAPRYQFAPNAPPQLRALFQSTQIRAPRPKAALLHISDGRNLRLRVDVSGVPAAAIQHVRLVGRVAGGSWSSALDGELTLTTGRSAIAEWYAEIIGPGQAVIWRDGSAERPHVLVDSVAAAPAPARAVSAARPAPKRWRWWVAGGAVVVAGALAAVGVLASRERPLQTTQVSAPVIQ